MLKPLHDHVVLEVIKRESTTSSGIILSTEKKEESVLGKVVAVGPGVSKEGELTEPQVSKGDIVLFKKFATNEIILDEKKYLVVKNSDLLAIVEE